MELVSICLPRLVIYSFIHLLYGASASIITKAIAMISIIQLASYSYMQLYYYYKAGGQTMHMHSAESCMKACNLCQQASIDFIAKL